MPRPSHERNRENKPRRLLVFVRIAERIYQLKRLSYILLKGEAPGGRGARRFQGEDAVEPSLVWIIILSLSFVFVQVLLIFFLAKRAIALKLGNLWFLIASSAAFIVTALLGAVQSPLQIFLQPFGPLFVIAFTKYTFYVQTRSRYALIMSVAMLFTGLTFVSRIYRSIAGDSDIMFLVNQAVLFCVFFPAYAWLAKACLDAYRRFTKASGTEPWIRKRYSLLGTSSVLTMFVTAPSFFMGTTSAFVTARGFVAILLIVSNLLIFSILNYLCWVMPPWFRNRLGASRAGDWAHLPGAGEQHDIPAATDKVLTNRETIAIIDYLGNILAVRINKSPSAIKGLLLVMFQGEQDERGTKPLNFSDVKRTINQKLSSRLEQLGIKEAEAITREFSDEVTRNQSILLMMSV